MTAAARFAVPRVDGAPTWYESAAYARVAAIDSALEIVDDSRGEANKTRNAAVHLSSPRGAYLKHTISRP